MEVSREINYQAIMRKEWYQEGINSLMVQLKKERTTIMCSEENPIECHRQHLVAQSLLSLGVEVLHIRKSGQLQPAWITIKGEIKSTVEDSPSERS